MDLPNLLNKIANNQEPPKFIAVEIGWDTVKVALWQSDGKHTEIVSIGSTQAFVDPTEDELLTAIDTSLADAQGSLPDEPDQVIFGLPDDWVENNKILETKKPLLKTICNKFHFRPIGFVITTMAISHYLRDIEGGPPSAILVQTAAKQVVVSLIYLGNLESTQVVERSTNIATDIEEALGKMPHSGNLPSRIIYLTGQEDPEPIKQELISYNWQQKLSFLHVPKVETLPKEWSIKAVAISGGAEVVRSIGVKPESPASPSPIKDISKQEKSTASPFGFKPVQLESNTVLSPPPTHSSDSSDESPQSNLEQEESNIEPAVLTPPITKPFSPNQHMRQIANMFRSIKLPSVSVPSPSKRMIIPTIIIAVLGGALVGGAFWAYRQYPRADIDINVSMNAYQQQINFVIDPNAAASDLEANVLAGTKTTLDVSGSKTIPTTGTRLVGDRAKGKVIIYNRTNAPKTLKAGTPIKANNLKFTLDTNVTVASASSKENPDFSVTIEPSTAEAMVTAADIGSQFNIPKGTQCTVDVYSTDTLFAVADSAFTGGSSQTVAAVAAVDLDTVKSALIKELQDQLATQTASGAASVKGQISVGEPKINEESYSAAKNEEATELTLKLSLSQVVYQYDPNELIVIAQTAAAKSLPANTQIRPDSTQVTIVSSTLNNTNQAQVSAQVMLYYIPRIDTTEIVKELTNTPINDMGQKLTPLPGFREYHLTNKKFLFFNRLPPTPEQINIRIVPITTESTNP